MKINVITSNHRWAIRRVTSRRSCRIIGVCGAVLVVFSALLSSPIGLASAPAAACPDVEVVFARGTTEPPGVGGTGQAFLDALRARVGDASLAVYPVDYPASTDFPTAADGVIDASKHVRAAVANCPGTKMVLGGYSQGAAVAGYLTANAIPAGFKPPPGISGPMPREVADHVAAVALFGKPSSEFLKRIGAPPIVIGPLYAGKTIDLCAPGDPVCSADGDNNVAHARYAVNGMVAQAADFTAHRLGPAPPPAEGSAHPGG